MRWSSGPSLAPLIVPFDTLYCFPEGTAGPHEACSATVSCRAGLVCHDPVFGTQFTCTPPCGTGFPACATGQICGEAGDGSGGGSYPTAVMGCEMLAGPGDSCDATTSCATGYSCYTLTVGTASPRNLCSKTCSSSSTCAAPISRCDSSGICVAP